MRRRVLSVGRGPRRGAVCVRQGEPGINQILTRNCKSDHAIAPTGRGGCMGLEGGCSCAALQYELTASPLIVHACHCQDCQRITGSAFVVNIWIEKEFVKTNGAIPKSFTLKGGSGKNHEVFFCDRCGTYVW